MTQQSVADDMLASGFRRWQALEAEKADIQSGLRDLFAELKGNGFDVKALRAAFRQVAQADDAERQEHEAIVDLYVDSLTRGTRTREGREAA